MSRASLQSTYRVSWYDTKEMDDPFNLVFVWAWEQLLCIASVPKQSLPPAEIPVAMSLYRHLLRLSEHVPQHPYQPPIPQPSAPEPAPQGPPQYAVFKPFPYYIPQAPDHSHGSHDSHHCQYSHHNQSSDHDEANHHSRRSQHSGHSQHSRHSQ
ncbi:hypothetical protein AHAS_Ahas03G0251500 [Arachis hypogaea]